MQNKYVKFHLFLSVCLSAIISTLNFDKDNFQKLKTFIVPFL